MLLANVKRCLKPRNIWTNCWNCFSTGQDLINCDDVTFSKENYDVFVLFRVLHDGRIPRTLRLTVCKGKEHFHRESRQCPVSGHVFSNFQQGRYISLAFEAICMVLPPSALVLALRCCSCLVV